jgi:SAM-dependent methyltransferase
MDAYREDLSHAHDTGYGAFAEQAAGAILRWLRPRGGLVVELGCGGGHSSRVFADAGFDVLGYDVSAPLVERARARVPEGRFEVGSFVDAPLPGGCAAVTAISEVLTYTFDARHSADALGEVFARVHAALRPGGLFAFDLLGPTGDVAAERSWREGPDWVTAVERSATGERLTRRIVTFRETPQGWRRDDETHEVLLLAPERVLAALRAVGFRAKRRRSYDGPRASAGHSVYLARRPG